MHTLSLHDALPICKELPVFGNHGDIRFIEANDESNHVMYEKISDSTGERILFVINNSDKDLIVTLPDGVKGTVLRDLWNGEEFAFAIDATALQVKLPAYGFQILGY